MKKKSRPLHINIAISWCRGRKIGYEKHRASVKKVVAYVVVPWRRIVAQFCGAGIGSYMYNVAQTHESSVIVSVSTCFTCCYNKHVVLICDTSMRRRPKGWGDAK